jgi:hypothetical protein
LQDKRIGFPTGGSMIGAGVSAAWTFADGMTDAAAAVIPAVSKDRRLISECVSRTSKLPEISLVKNSQLERFGKVDIWGLVWQVRTRSF